MEYYLIFHIDKEGNDGIVLKQTNDLFEIDKYIQDNFKTREEVFNHYIDYISEFCLDKIKKIQDENKRNNHNRLGSISLFCKYENAYGIRKFKIPIIYGNDKKILSNNNCIRKIKEKLNDTNILKKLLITKEYLLSYYERNLLRYYLDSHDLKIKDKFINDFINRLKKMTNEKKYFFYRCLTNLCSLNVCELKIKNGNISIGNEIPTNTYLEKENNHFKISDLDDDYYTSLIENQDYDNLHKYYDIETIEKYSNIRGLK